MGRAPIGDSTVNPESPTVDPDALSRAERRRQRKEKREQRARAKSLVDPTSPTMDPDDTPSRAERRRQRKEKREQRAVRDAEPAASPVPPTVDLTDESPSRS